MSHPRAHDLSRNSGNAETWQAFREDHFAASSNERNLRWLAAIRQQDDSGVKDAVDGEIRRKETKENFDNLFKQTENLTIQTDKLVGQIVQLVGIAAEQKRLAEKLDGQTETIISLTRWLKGLTIALVVLAIPLFLEALHVVKVGKDTVQASPNVQQPSRETQISTNH